MPLTIYICVLIYIIIYVHCINYKMGRFENPIVLGSCKFSNATIALKFICKVKLNIFLLCRMWQRSNKAKGVVNACATYKRMANKDPTLRSLRDIFRGWKTKTGEFPHMAAIGYEITAGNQIKLEFGCSGSLISDRYVLTAAHCLFRSDNVDPKIVRLGKINVGGDSNQNTEQDYLIEKAIPYPKYLRSLLYNDIAVLRLTRSVTFSRNVRPACLNVHKFVPNDESLVVTGWGVHDESSLFTPDRLLQQIPVNHVNIFECKRTFLSHSAYGLPNHRLHHGIDHVQHICALGSDFQDACYGDSGGPLQMRHNANTNVWTIIGITSFGNGCGSKSPGVYVRVSSFVEWIETVVWGDKSIAVGHN